jgi:beta-galactosidase
MKRVFCLACLLSMLSGLVGLHAQPNQTLAFDFDWRFALGDHPEAAQAHFDDRHWRLLDLPHDWSIEGEYRQTANGTDWQSGYLPAGIGWYRKTFQLDPHWKGKHIRIHFDGVYMNSTVRINGHLLGTRPNGYIGFEYDLTPYLRPGDNVIAVKVDHSKPLSARWYTGSGIYRHVWLKVDPPQHIPTWGVFFRTTALTPAQATAEVETTVANSAPHPADLQLHTSLTDPNGRVVARAATTLSLPGGAQQTLRQTLAVEQPRPWSVDSPERYTLHSVLTQGKQTLYRQQMEVGLRTIALSPQGLLLNGEPIKIKGVCDHHTAGALGAALPDQALERRLRLLKAMGCNAIRTAHNPFSPQFYTICDTLGLIVMNEALDGWEKPKARDDYGNYFDAWWQRDLTDWLLRDRNHPSILFWSIGNEVPQPRRAGVQHALASLVHRLAPDGWVTQGGADPTRGMKPEYVSEVGCLDLVGFNGTGENRGELERFARDNPDAFAIGTEMPHTYQTRGVYRTQTQWRLRDFPAPWELKRVANAAAHIRRNCFPIPNLTEQEVFTEEADNRYYQSSYDNAAVRISARRSWQRTNAFPWLLGEFRWGSFDYLGEAAWPQRCGNFGIIDLCGFPKDHYYLYQSLWSTEPIAHILPHWTHPGKEGVEIPVVVYTNCASAELFLNGKSLGKKNNGDGESTGKERNSDGDQLMWLVPYAPGTLTAICRTAQGTEVARTSVRTAGEVSRIALTPDRTTLRANRTDVAHIELTLTDAHGTMCPLASDAITFDLSGPARLLGVDNGDPTDLSPYKVLHRKAFRGKAFIVIQSTGKPGLITVKAQAGKVKAEITLPSNQTVAASSE